MLHPIRGAVVAPDAAARVVTPAYDALTTRQRRALRSVSDLTFLHGLPPDARPGHVTAADLAHAEAAVARLSAAAFHPAPAPFVGVYRLREGDHEQTGLVADLDVDAFGVTVAGHETTHRTREDDLVRYLEVVGVQSSPVSLAHPPAPELAAALTAVTRDRPTVTLPATEDDSVSQDLWVVDDPATVARLLAAAAAVPDAVITDGHHRVAAARRFARTTADPAGRRVLAVLFPADRIRVAAFHRLVDPPLPVHPADLAAALRATDLPVRPLVTPGPPSRPGDVAMLAAGRWWEVVVGDRASTDPVAAADVWLLQRRVLDPVLGITEPRTDGRLRYVPGPVAVGAIEDLTERDGAAFLVHPPTVEILLAAGRRGAVLPPKSTYVHPKVRSGLLLVPRSADAAMR